MLVGVEAHPMAMLEGETMIQVTPGLSSQNMCDVEQVIKPFPRIHILLEYMFLAE